MADGALLPNGMPQFTDLEDSEVLAIYEYMRQKRERPSMTRLAPGVC